MLGSDTPNKDDAGEVGERSIAFSRGEMVHYGVEDIERGCVGLERVGRGIASVEPVSGIHAAPCTHIHSTSATCIASIARQPRAL